MPDTTITEAQRVYERIEALTAEGLTNADAIRKVAEESGKKENAVRANQHQHRQKLRGGAAAPTSRGRGRMAKKAEATAGDAIAQARALLEGALAGLDRRVDDAKSALDAAQEHYDEVVASIKAEKAELEQKIKALG